VAASRDETRLLERLLADPEFRARFRTDPQAAAEEAGIELPEELANGDPMKTLDGRESKSSFAGAAMAAAVEGIGLYELGLHVLPGADDAAAATEMPASHHWDPAEFGQTGTGGPPTAETLDLLQNKNVTFDADGIADLKAGRIDPRIVSVLEAVAGKHRITISAMVSDHDKFTAGGSISNHYYGRAVDIATVDGRPVTPGNLAARQLAVALTKLAAGIRPSEIGSPWQLPGSEDFSDAAHQNHIHVAFDDPINPGWTPQAGSAEPSTPTPEPVEAPEQPDGEDTQAEEDADAASAIVRSAAATPVDPDDLEGNLDDEDGGADEEDGSNEDEADEAGGEDDDGGTDDEEADGGEEEGEDDDGADGGEEDEDEDEDEGQDEPGEGSSGEDATDDNAGDSDDESPDQSDPSDPSDGSDGGSPEVPDAGGVDTDYPGDNAPQEQIAAWMATAAEKRGLPPELPVMASLTESSLRNLDYGDADSIGFFQMRTSIWDQGEYAGYGKQPHKQLDWFLDQAEAIKKQRLERGLPVDDPNQFGQWIADVERPAAQYRGRYQLRLEEARKLLGKA
jgi:hypothetical protein